MKHLDNEPITRPPVVVVYVLNQHGLYLAVEVDSRAGRLLPVSGTMEPGEDLLDTVERELAEELPGLDITAGYVLGSFAFRGCVAHAFMVEAWTGCPTPGGEVKSLAWVPFDVFERDHELGAFHTAVARLLRGSGEHRVTAATFEPYTPETTQEESPC